MRSKPLYIAVSLILCLSLCACARLAPRGDTASAALAEGALLPKTEDMGQAYIDGFVFLGESTTYHLKSRGVLSDGKDTKQVWAPKSGTVSLDSTVSSLRIVYPETGEELTVGEAAARKRPERMLLCFGLNGAVGKIKKGEEYFKSCYLELINAVRGASPETSVMLGSCYPVARNMDMTDYTVEVEELQACIDTINRWSAGLAAEEGLSFLDLAEAVKGEDGFLLEKYDSGDGYHLNTAAYVSILEYIRTHGEIK